MTAPAALPRRRPTVLFDDGWRHTAAVAIGAIAFVAVKLHEGMPFLWYFRVAILTAIAGLLVVLWQSADGVAQRALRDPAMRFALFYTAWAAVGVPFSMYPSMSLNTLRTLVAALCTQMLVLMARSDTRTLNKIVSGAFWAAVLSCIALFVLHRGSGSERFGGTHTLDPNDLAAIMASMVPLGVGMIARTRSFGRKLAYGAGSAIIVAAIVATASRGGFLALAAATVAYVLGQRGSRRVVFIVLAAVASAVVWQQGTVEFRERIGGLLAGEEDYNTTSFFGRKQVWRRGFGYAVENPVLGVGADSFTIAEGATCTRLKMQGCKWSAPHSAYVQAAAELGFPGLVTLIGILLASLAKAWRLWRPGGRRGVEVQLHRPELFAALVGFMVGAIFLSFAYAAVMFALAGIISLAHRNAAQVLAGARAPAELPSHTPAPVRAVRRAGVRGGLARFRA